MKEIVIDREQLHSELQHLKDILRNTTTSNNSDNAVLVPLSTLDYAVKCMERLIEVYDQTAVELLVIDEPEESMVEAYLEYERLTKSQGSE